MNFRSVLKKNHSSGFTLLEILIAIVLLTIISVGAARLYYQTFRVRDTLTVNGDFFNTVRLALGVLEKDISLAYSPTIMLPYKPRSLTTDESQELNTLLRGDEKITSDYWLQVLDKTGIRPTRFAGKNDVLSFVSTSHRRIYKEAPESEFLRVQYELADDDDPNENQKSTRILIKRMSPNAFLLDDSEDDDYEKVYPLLKGVKKLKYRFYSRVRSEWYDEWDSGKIEFKNLFPDVVEVEIEVLGPDPTLAFSGVFRFKPEIPINGLIPSS